MLYRTKGIKEKSNHLTLSIVLRFFLLAAYCLIIGISHAVVKYDEGRLEINGIQLLQDSENALAYYYIPPYPRISMLENGDFEFMCTKYVGLNGKASSGGLFHVLVQFSLSKEETKELEKRLKEKIPNAILMGAVPMMEDEEKKDAPGFRIVSTILNAQEKNPFTSNIITSGKAPFLPGSKAAIAAHLEPDGATLLWDSFQGVTSDVSIVVEGYFLAKVKAYKATVKADLEVVYQHFSSFKNNQSGFTRDQATHILDSLCQSGTIDIDVADMSAGLKVDTEPYQNLLNIITERIVDQMFNVKSGWAKIPETEKPIQPTDLKERYQRGAFVRFFVGDGTQTYIPDDQLLLKSKTEIRNFHFFLNLNQSTVIKVPVYSAGNIRGFYDEYKNDKRYFRVVDMNDPDYQFREVHFQINGSFIPSFGDIIDQVSIIVQKDYPDENANSFTGILIFNKASIDSGKIIQSLSYQRLGDKTEDWLKYKYKVGWKFIGVDSMITVPEKDWTTTDLSSISIEPPFDRTDVEVGIDKQLQEQAGIQSVRIRFASMLFNKPYKGKMLVLRGSNADESMKTTVYHDKDQPLVYQVNWYSNNGIVEDKLKVLNDDYLFLIPPKSNKQ